MSDADHNTDAEVAELAAEIERLRTELDRLQAPRRPFELRGRLVHDHRDEADDTITTSARVFTETGVWRAEQIERRTPGGRWFSILTWPERPGKATRAD